MDAEEHERSEDTILTTLGLYGPVANHAPRFALFYTETIFLVGGASGILVPAAMIFVACGAFSGTYSGFGVQDVTLESVDMHTVGKQRSDAIVP